MLFAEPEDSPVNKDPNDRCIAHLAAGGLVLVPNLRQARILRRLHDRAQVAIGRQVWPTARVLPIDAWLELEWQLASDWRPELPVILPATALCWLWRREVARSAPALLDPADLAARARGSWLKLRAHGADLAAVTRWPLTRDQQAFLSWSRSFEKELRERGACDGADLARRLADEGVVTAAGPPVLLAGFRKLSPAQASLFAALSAAGRTVEFLAPPPSGVAGFRHAAAEPDSERRDMIAWIRERVALAPDGIHAAIVPDLDANRGALERALAAALQPDVELPGAHRDDRAFDLAGGHPLVAQPVVDTALAAIACATGPVDWATASRLLLSPHVAGCAAERGARVAMDLALRGLQGAMITGSRQLADRARRAGAGQLAAAISSAVAALDGPRRRPARAWAEAFGRSLAAWGWPGEAALGSREFQAADKLRELVLELASLGDVAGDLEGREALAELRRLAGAPFQPESGEPAVFVLDAYEDPGVQLDSLWVAGLTAAAWPRPVAIDPLLPIEIQRQLDMPGATPEGRVAEARELMARWQARARALVMSWPRVENDTEVDGTPLVPAACAPLPSPGQAPTRERLCFGARRLEGIPEAPLAPLAGTRVKGGARLLELQAKCGFRAFAELRLEALPLEEPQAGFDRRLRGVVLHAALQEFWTQLGGQAALVALDSAARDARVASAVEDALAAAIPAGTGARAVALERDWQCAAIGRLLDREAARPRFTVVEAERALDLAIGGLELSLRVDRTDRIGDELVVLDYKTGRIAGSAWRGARMDAPQLPLYAVLHPDRPTGIAFAGVGAARARFIGVGRDAAAIDGMQAPEKFALTEDEEKGFAWPAITAHWRAWLERLAADFAAGRADVDPKLGAATCRLCHLAALCRVEASVTDEGPGGNDDD
jgi:probable DNA repair protein